MRFAKLFCLIVSVLYVCDVSARADNPVHRKLSAVPFTAVKFQDTFWAPRIEINRQKCLALWSQRMCLMHADAQYADVLERVLYNGVLAGIGMDGKHFFYVNPLASAGNHHRQPFFDCACCPTNVVRVIPSLPGYVYAQDGQSLYVNLYVAGMGEIVLGDANVRVTQQTNYPWDGEVKLVVEPSQEQAFTIRLRIPGWARAATVSVNGQTIPSPVIEKGYACLERRWRRGDTIALSLPMPVTRIEAHPAVAADRGWVAIQRGPIVYALEATDNSVPVQSIILARDPKFATHHREDLLGGVTVIETLDRAGHKVVAVPYYAWDHRQPGQMAVWIRQVGGIRQVGCINVLPRQSILPSSRLVPCSSG